jgi:hypothetical protein
MTAPTTAAFRTTTSTTVPPSASPYRGRRLSWQEFYAQRPDLRPADNDDKAGDAYGYAPRLLMKSSLAATCAGETGADTRDSHR